MKKSPNAEGLAWIKKAIKQGCQGFFVLEPGGKRILLKKVKTSSKPEKFRKFFKKFDGGK